MVDMVITGTRFSGRKSRSVNNSLRRPYLGLQKAARYQKIKENQTPISGKTKHSGNVVLWPSTPARYQGVNDPHPRQPVRTSLGVFFTPEAVR